MHSVCNWLLGHSQFNYQTVQSYCLNRDGAIVVPATKNAALINHPKDILHDKNHLTQCLN